MTGTGGRSGRCTAGIICGLACALAFGSAAVHAQEADELPADADVPALGTAYILAFRPQARMLEDGATCELIAGILTFDGQPVDGSVQLSRGRSRRVFMEVKTREDGLVIAHFPARPNEVVTGRAYWRDPRGIAGDFAPVYTFGPRVQTRCLSGRALLGEPSRIPPDRP